MNKTEEEVVMERIEETREKGGTFLGGSEYSFLLYLQ